MERATDSSGYNAEDDVTSAIERLEVIAREIGAVVATNNDVFIKLLPDLLRGGNRVWAFGRGLASASLDLRATWARLVEGLEQIAPEQRNIQILRGFLAEIWERDRDLAQCLLDAALDQPALVVFLPALHTAIDLDERGAQRLKQALRAGQVPIWMYQNLAVGRTTDHIAGAVLKDLLLLIADQDDGFDVAVEILAMRLYSDSSSQREHDLELLEVGRELLRRIMFQRSRQRNDHELAIILNACLKDPNASLLAAEVASRLRQSVVSIKVSLFNHDDLLKTLLELQPVVTLDALFIGDKHDQWVGTVLFDSSGGSQGNLANVISCEDLIAWCERDGDYRYPLAASIITFACRPNSNEPQAWSEQAKALLTRAPNPKAVLKIFIERFRPMGWEDSRAALMEINAQLLDSLESHVPSDIMPFVIEARAQFAQEIARERQQETERDRARDERFE